MALNRIKLKEDTEKKEEDYENDNSKEEIFSESHYDKNKKQTNKKRKEGGMETYPEKIIRIKQDIINTVYNDFIPNYKEKSLGIPEEETESLQEKIDQLSEEELFSFRENYNKFALSGSYSGKIIIEGGREITIRGKKIIKGGRKVMEMDAERDMPRLLYFIETVFGKDNREMIQNGIILRKALKTRIHPKTKKTVINTLRILYTESGKIRDDEKVSKARATVRKWLSRLCGDNVRSDMAADEMADFFEDIELSFLLANSEEEARIAENEIFEKLEDEWQNFRNNGLEYAITSVFKIEALKKLLYSIEKEKNKEYLTPEEEEALTPEEQKERIRAAKLAEVDAIYNEFEKASGSKEKRRLSANQKLILDAQALRDLVAVEVSDKAYDALFLRAAKISEEKKIKESMNYDAAQDYYVRTMDRFLSLNNVFSFDDSEINGKTFESEKAKINECLKSADNELEKKNEAETWKIMKDIKKAERIMKRLLDKKNGRKSKKLGIANIKRIKQLVKAEEEDYAARNLPESELKKLDFLSAARGELSTEQILAFKRDPYKFIDDYYIKQYNKNQKKEEK